MVVVGGDLSAAGELLLGPLREAVMRAALPAATEGLDVVAGVLGERANVLGALALAIAQSEQAVAARIAAAGTSEHEPQARPSDHRRREHPCQRITKPRGLAVLATAGTSPSPASSPAVAATTTAVELESRLELAAPRSQAVPSASCCPDSKSSVRWETVDRPLLKKAFEAAGVKAIIENAEGDKSTQQQQAEQAITNGAKVLLLVNLDSGSGAAIAANAKSQGVKVIDYDRLTLNGDSDYYVSFDNEQVGKLQGQGLVDCLGDTQRPVDRRAQRLADRQQRDAVQERLRLASSTRCTRTASSRRSPISPCRTGTTRRR